MKHTSRVILGLIACTALLVPSLSAPAQAQTASQRALQLAHSVSLASFTKVATHTKKGLDKSFNWSTDGCSLPGIPGLTKGWNTFFRKACVRHDFSYRNLGHGAAYAPTPSSKDAIDSQFKSDMETQCHSYSGGFAQCWSVAQAYYTGLHKTFSDKSWTAFTGSTCPAGYFCLFDDHSFGDRRMVLKSSVKNLKSIDFGDKTSSAWNKTSRAWVLYDDDGYHDTAKCLKPGKKVSDFNKYGFGDKTSSVKIMSGSGCPSGVSSVGS